VRKIFTLVSRRAPGLCNFLDAPELAAELTPAATDGKGEAVAEGPLRVVYRNYATLYFVFVVDSAESELGVLDLIQVMLLYWNVYGWCRIY
jgi:AP-3 complex subunit sigma